MAQPLYSDPADKASAFSLLGELSKVASTPDRVPAEDQLTTFLAWLSDNDETFARELAASFLAEDDDEARAALSASSTVRADTQLKLPPLGKGLLWPDLSLVGSDRAFQLLVEVKVGSDFHQHAVPGAAAPLMQPDAYLLSWDSLDPEKEARVRRLGTLTLDGKAPGQSSPRRALDRSWADVLALLERLEDRLSCEVAAVAADLARHLRERVLPPEVSLEFLQRGARLVRGVCAMLRPRVRHGTISGAFAANEKFAYAGGYLSFDSPEADRVKLWFVITPPGGDYNVPSEPASLQITTVYGDPPSESARLRLLGAGFAEEPDKAGFRLLRAALPLDELEGEEGAQLDTATTWGEGLLEAAGFLDTPDVPPPSRARLDN